MWSRKFVARERWFHALQFLQGKLPRTKFVSSDAETGTHLAIMVAELALEPDFIQRFSRLPRLVNTITRCRRWWSRASGPLSAQKLKQAEWAVIRYQQKQLFERQIFRIKKGLSAEKNHWLATLRPFMDEISEILGYLQKRYK